ncbi:MAG: adenylyl-sulfate kinase [Proteobacteria bacterium]|nr:adenylyl-sulfate kinase [Pseudomonadota bacterium]
MKQGFCIYLTGRAGSGKAGLAGLLQTALEDAGLEVAVLGEALVDPSDPEAGWSRLARQARDLVDGGRAVVVAARIPGRRAREAARSEIGRFVEVYLDLPEATAGPGLDFEPPKRPEAVLRPDVDGPADGLARVLRTLEILGYLSSGGEGGYSPEDEAVLRGRLSDLGYL